MCVARSSWLTDKLHGVQAVAKDLEVQADYCNATKLQDTPSTALLSTQLLKTPDPQVYLLTSASFCTIGHIPVTAAREMAVADALDSVSGSFRRPDA